MCSGPPSSFIFPFFHFFFFLFFILIIFIFIFKIQFFSYQSSSHQCLDSHSLRVLMLRTPLHCHHCFLVTFDSCWQSLPSVGFDRVLHYLKNCVEQLPWVGSDYSFLTMWKTWMWKEVLVFAIDSKKLSIDWCTLDRLDACTLDTPCSASATDQHTRHGSDACMEAHATSLHARSLQNRWHIDLHLLPPSPSCRFFPPAHHSLNLPHLPKLPLKTTTMTRVVLSF